MSRKTISGMMLVLLIGMLTLMLNLDGTYASAGATYWNIETVDDAGDVGLYNSIAVDSSNRPHVSYCDHSNNNLKYAYYDGSMWHKETVDSGGNVGLDTSIALDSYDNPHISYCDWSNGDLKYAYYDGSTWHTGTVDSISAVGQYNSLALDSADKPHISYLDYSSYDLKYAYYDGSTWHTEIVDSGGDVGRWSSLALDSVNTPHISYGDYTNYYLKHAYYDGTTWYKEIVDSDYSSWGTSIILDYNWPYVSYCGGDPNFDLKYAHYYLGAWYTETVDSSGDLGMWYNSIALDSSDYPHISYCNWTAYDFDLKYAYFDGSTWHTETVDSSGDVGKYNSIALDSCNKPHISYYDSTNGYLKYATVCATPPVQLTFNTVHDWAPSITYSGKWFASETASDEIYVGPFDGSQPPSLITADGNHPQIGDYGTPEGDWVVVWTRYYPPPNPQADIYLYDNYHATEEQLTTTSWSDTWPSISRREAYLHLVAYQSYVDDLDPEICACPLTSPHTVTQLTDNILADNWPSQSSGGRIAFVTIPAGESDHEIQVYSGGSIIRLTTNDIDDEGPSISDDGYRVVWYDDDHVGNTRIWRANSDGSLMSQIASGSDPEISGDGQWVVFVDDRTGNNEVYITSWNVGESYGVWNLSNDPADDDGPSISSLTDCGTYHVVWSSNRASDDEIWGCTFAHPPVPVPPTVGGLVVPVDKFGLLAPYIGLASTMLVATVATAIYVKRVKHRKEKQ